MKNIDRRENISLLLVQKKRKLRQELFSIGERIGKFVLCVNRKVIAKCVTRAAIPLRFFRKEIEKGYAAVLLT